jgi:hypothetical protein
MDAQHYQAERPGYPNAGPGIMTFFMLNVLSLSSD